MKFQKLFLLFAGVLVNKTLAYPQNAAPTEAATNSTQPTSSNPAPSSTAPAATSQPTNANSSDPNTFTDCDNLKLILNEYNETEYVFDDHTMGCCDDEKFICKNIDGIVHITEIDLSYQYLEGNISRTFSNFTMLEKLDLRSNKLVGSIPEDFKLLTNLKYLDISTNFLSGDFPFFLGEMSNLRVFDASNNEFRGTLPESLNKLSFLEKFSVRYNLISGEITDFFQNTPNLTHIDLSLNKFSGKIPKGIGELSNITEIHLNNNKLKGSVPSSFTKLPNLEVLYLSFNELSGRVPDMPKSLRLCSYKNTDLCIKEDAICGKGVTPICSFNYKNIFYIVAGICVGLGLVGIVVKKCRHRDRSGKPKKKLSDQALLGGDEGELGEFVQLKETDDQNRRYVEVDEDFVFDQKNIGKFIN